MEPHTTLTLRVKDQSITIEDVFVYVLGMSKHPAAHVDRMGFWPFPSLMTLDLVGDITGKAVVAYREFYGGNWGLGVWACGWSSGRTSREWTLKLRTTHNACAMNFCGRISFFF